MDIGADSFVHSKCHLQTIYSKLLTLVLSFFVLIGQILVNTMYNAQYAVVIEEKIVIRRRSTAL